MAAFYRELEQRGGIRLPANTPEEIASSVRAVRARKALRNKKLIVVESSANVRQQEELRRFAAGARDRLGVEIVIREISEMKARAAATDDAAADRELKRWYAEVLEGPGEMNDAHMRQVATSTMPIVTGSARSRPTHSTRPRWSWPIAASVWPITT